MWVRFYTDTWIRVLPNLRGLAGAQHAFGLCSREVAVRYMYDFPTLLNKERL